MYKNNIRTAIFLITGLVIFLSIILFFLKLEKIESCTMFCDTSQSYVLVDKKNTQYIQEKNISKIKIEYLNVKYWSKIEFQNCENDYGLYWIYLPAEFDKSQQYFNVNIIIKTVNVYQYIFNY